MSFTSKRKALKLRAKLGDTPGEDPFIKVVAFNTSRAARKRASLCKIGRRKAIRAVCIMPAS